MSRKLNYCLMTGANYICKALALYRSILNYGNDFTFYYYCFDNSTYEFLNKCNLPNIIPIQLNELEDKELLAIKNTRTIQEYYFTCTPSLILYTLQKFKLNKCIYVDADMYFYADPNILIDEMNGASIMLTEHKYSPGYDRSDISGKYCVQFMPFNNDEVGRESLNWWRNSCIDWCYLRAENGKWADQGYLNDWVSRFEGVYILKNLGGGVAPWNVQQYEFIANNSSVMLRTKIEKLKFDLVFYHFQGLKIYYKKFVEPSSYRIDLNIYNSIYVPYIAELFEIQSTYNKIDPSLDILGNIKINPKIKSYLSFARKLLTKQILLWHN